VPSDEVAVRDRVSPPSGCVAEKLASVLFFHVTVGTSEEPGESTSVAVMVTGVMRSLYCLDWEARLLETTGTSLTAVTVT